MNSIANLDDVADQIYKALIFEENKSKNEEIISGDDQIKFIKKYINKLTVEQKKSLGNLLITNGRKSALNYCKQGTVINLDSLSPDILLKIYNLMIYFLKKD